MSVGQRSSSEMWELAAEPPESELNSEDLFGQEGNAQELLSAVEKELLRGVMSRRLLVGVGG